MTSRFLKDNGAFIKGLNEKNLRYIYYKDTGKVLVKFRKNWSNNAINFLEDCYGKDLVEIEKSKPRGRPKKTENRLEKRKEPVKLKNSIAVNDSSDEENDTDRNFLNFKINDRVKCQEYEELGFGIICKLEVYVNDEGNSYFNAHVKYENDEVEICGVESLKRARGRRPKPKFIEEKNQVEGNSDEDKLSLIKIDGELYLTDSKNEVYDLDSTYLGWYDGEKIKRVNV